MKKLFLCLLAAVMVISFGACSLQTGGKATVGSVPEVAKPVWLYPAYIMDNNSKKWGFIDDTGKFAIQPQYDSVYDFQDNGLAIVCQKEAYGIIDKSGKALVEVKYDYIDSYYEGLAVAKNKNGTYDVLDEQGKVVFTSTDYLGSFKNGMSVVTKYSNDNQITYGYMDKTGNLAIQPVFKSASNFEEDRALVKLDEQKYAIIDSKGNTIKELDYQQMDPISGGAIAYLDKNGKFGYLNTDGGILIEAKFNSAGTFENGYAIVGVEDVSDPTVMKFGLVDKKGEFVIKPEYASLNKIGKGYYSASKESIVSYMDPFSKKAVINSKGEVLTGFDYYDVGSLENGLVSVSDGNTTFFIDEKGKKVKELPTASGAGDMKVQGNIVVGHIDNETIYMAKDGKVIWQPDSSVKLADGTIIMEKKYRPDRGMLIRYPELTNMKDQNLQSKLNKKLKKLFVGDNQTSRIENGMIAESYDAGYSASLNKDLLVLEKSDYVYPVGAAHGMPGRTVYHINLKDGSFYELKDLFKKGSDYTTRISKIIEQQIKEQSKKEDSMFFEDQYTGIAKDQHFVLTDKALQIYFYPYEIAAYAAGFPSFDIPYSDIMDIIDDKGELWNSFDKSTAAGQGVDAEQNERQLAEATVKTYESGLVEAINSNDFTKVKGSLYPDSKLYKDQAGLVASLFKKGIKERLDKFQVFDVKKEPDGSLKVYVEEDITLQRPGAPDYSGKYNWVYTARYSEDQKTYLLSDIEKWNK